MKRLKYLSRKRKPDTPSCSSKMETSERPHTITPISSLDLLNPHCSFPQQRKATQCRRNGQNILVNQHLGVFVANFIFKKITKDSHHVTGSSFLAVVRIQLKCTWLEQQHQSLVWFHPNISLWCLRLLSLTRSSTAWYNYLLPWLYVCFHGNEDYAGIFIKFKYIDRCEVKAEVPRTTRWCRSRSTSQSPNDLRTILWASLLNWSLSSRHILEASTFAPLSSFGSEKTKDRGGDQVECG